MTKKFIMILCLILMVSIFVSCDGKINTNNPSTTPSVDKSTDSLASVFANATPLDPFCGYFVFSSFEEIGENYRLNRADIFYKTTDETNGYKTVTESISAARKSELSDVFPGYTYIPCYEGKPLKIVQSESIAVRIPSFASLCVNDATSCASNGVRSYTEFRYMVAFEWQDGGRSYAYVYTVHGEKALRDWYIAPMYDVGLDHRHTKYMDGKNREWAVTQHKTNSSSIQLPSYLFKYDEKTLVAMSFSLDALEIYEQDFDSSKYPDHIVPDVLYSSDWLSKLSFKRIDFDKGFELEYLQNDNQPK